MATEAEEVKSALENARDAGDDAAVRALERYEERIKRRVEQAESPEPTAGALPQIESPTQTKSRKKTNGTMLHTGRGRAFGAGGAITGALQASRERAISLEAYKADQALPKPTNAELRRFKSDNFRSDAPGGGVMGSENLRRDVVKDPTTGNVRWAALHPDRMKTVEKEGDLLKSIPVGITTSFIRQIGGIMQGADAEKQAMQNTNQVIWTALPNEERKRIRNEVSRRSDAPGPWKSLRPSEVTDDLIFKMTPTLFKEFLDQNPNNQQVFADIVGDEEQLVGAETAKRIGNMISATVPYMPVNIFNADDPTAITYQDVLGLGKYEGIDESYDKQGLKRPAAPGASKLIADWLSEAEQGTKGFGAIYHGAIAPLFEAFGDPDKLPGEKMVGVADWYKKQALTPEQFKKSEKPYFPPGTQLFAEGDIFKKETWTDPNTALPHQDWDAFVLKGSEQLLYLIESIYATRSFGRLGAKEAARTYAGRSLDVIEKMRKRYATIYGVLGGGTAEGAMIYNQMQMGVRQAMDAIPMERWREDEQFVALVATGMTEEGAKQLMIHDAATVAGKVGFWGAGILAGGPTQALIGRSAAGSLLGKNKLLKALGIAIADPAQEGVQEVIEGEFEDIAVGKVDPNNPIFKDTGRRSERFGGGWLGVGPVSAVSAAGALSGDVPAGYQKEDVKAAEAAKRFMDIRNERFAYELEISDPDHIKKTSPTDRLNELNKLEQLQKKEAMIIRATERVLRPYFETHPTRTSEAELQILDSLTMWANATLTDIAVARQRRTTATEMVAEQEQILEERALLQSEVGRDLIRLEDIQRLARNIETVQTQGSLTEGEYAELQQEGYGAWRGPNKERFVILPKGKRALNLLMQQSRALEGKLTAGYTGEEKRLPENIALREIVEKAGPAERERLLLQDHLTGVGNRRAFDEYVSRIESEVETAPVVAAVDVDSLPWINDNMSMAAGDRVLVAVADAISKQKGVKVFRVGGDNFAVTGASEAVLEKALQAAATELSNTPIRAAEDRVTPQITWGKGATYAAANDEAGAMKRQRIKTGVVAERKGKAKTYAARQQVPLLQTASISDEVSTEIDALIAEDEVYRDIDQTRKRDRIPYEEAGAARRAGESVQVAKQREKRRAEKARPQNKKQNAEMLERMRLTRVYRAEGLTNSQIAKKLGVTTATIDRYAGKIGSRRSIEHRRSVERVAELRRAGMRNSEIAADMGKSVDQIRKWTQQAERLGVDMPPVPKPPPSEVRIEIFDLYRQGVKQARIAEQVGISHQSVSKALQIFEKKHGKGLFQLTDMEGRVIPARLPRRWSSIRHEVRRGDNVEVITPDGAIQAVVTNVRTSRKKPRITVVIGGREFRFNPAKNHLITANTNRTDLAWLTGNAEYAQPDHPPLPQTIPDVYVGHVGRDGDWYADIGQNFDVGIYDTSRSLDVFGSYWETEYPEWSTRVKYVYKAPEATEEEMRIAEAVKHRIAEDFKNLPEITLVKSLEHLEEVNPELAQRLKDFPGASVNSVKGFFDEEYPENGVVIMVQNIYGAGTAFEAKVLETIYHELIGHFGIRGMFGNEALLRKHMHSIVDAFPKIAKMTEGRVGKIRVGQTPDEYKQLIGEEMIAYITGEMMAGTITLTKPQRNVIQQFFDWIRDFFVRHGMGQYFPAPDKDNLYGFWTDEKIQAWITRAQDFVRNGDGWSFDYLDGRHTMLMRDGGIFQLGTISAINTATKKLKKQERQALKKQSPEGATIPTEAPLFPEVGSPNVWKQAIVEAGPGQGKQNLITHKELELVKLQEKGAKGAEAPWNFFTDATYDDIRKLSGTVITDPDTHVPDGWYREVMPFHLAEEYDELMKIVTSPENFVRPDDRAQIVLDAEARIREILNSKIDQKKAQISKAHVMAFLGSEKPITVTVVPSGGYPNLTEEEASERLFGREKGRDDSVDEIFDIRRLNEVEREMVKHEIAETAARGYDVGFDEDQGTWFDRMQRNAEYASSTPEGANFANDYRVVFIRQAGGGIPMGHSSHFSTRRNSDNRVGVLVHIRTGTAEVMDIDGQVMPIAMRPEMEGKLLSLVEQQTDWLQNLRKSYNSASDQAAGSMRERVIVHALRGANKELSIATTEKLITALNAQLLPIANLPKGSLKTEFEEYFQERFGADISTASESESKNAYLDFRDSKVRSLIDDLGKIQFDLTELARLSRDYPLVDLPGSLDARTFDRLDAYAASKAASFLADDIDTLVVKLRHAGETQYSDQTAFVDYIKSVMSSDILERFNNAMKSGMQNNVDLRLAVTSKKFDNVLKTLFEKLGVPEVETEVAALTERLKTRPKVIYKMPMERMKDYVRAIEGKIDAEKIAHSVQQMFENTSLLDNGVSPDKLKVQVSISPSGQTLNIEAIGSQSGLDELADNFDNIIRDWVTKNSSEIRARAIRDERARLLKDVKNIDNPVSRDGNPDWNDIVQEWNIEEYDTDERQTELDDQGVYSYEEFEEDRYSDEMDSQIRYEIDENTDWSEVTNADGESLGREDPAYRERLDIAEDGDVDNTDAEEWLSEQRDEYEQNLRDEDWMRENVSENLRNLWYEEPSMLWVGEMPVQWDEGGNVVDTVGIVMKRENHGEMVTLEIAGDDQESWHMLADASLNAHRWIMNWYDSSDIHPPPGDLFGPETTAPDPTQQVLPLARNELEAEAERLLNLPSPNWEMISNGLIVDITGVQDEKGESLAGMFNELVVLTKRHGTNVDTPLKEDKVWRLLSLKFLLADAVRRGLPGIVWNPGLATSARGGAAFEGVATDRITWSVETIEIRGEDKEVWVIRSPELNKPMVVSQQHAVPILGGDVVGYIHRQINGTLPLNPVKRDDSGAVLDDRSSQDDFTYSAIEGTDSIAIHDRFSGRMLGIVPSLDEANAFVELEVTERNRNLDQAQEQQERTVLGETIPVSPIGEGEVKMSGVVTREDMGGQIRIIVGKSPSGYSHTFPIPTLGGARTSYEEISPRIWNKELKQYGVEIGEIYVKAQNLRIAETQQGARILPSNEREKNIEAEHGKLEIKELTGSHHGWVIFSDNQGVIYNEIHNDRGQAEVALERYIKDTYGDEKGGVKVAYIPINAAIREQFSGPVPPFAYDPMEDPDLQDAAKKIGYEKTTLLQRVAKFRASWKDEFGQGVADRFYGIYRSLNMIGADMGPYHAARLTTSLDTVMKSVLLYGHPVWKENIVQTEGRGLLRVLDPVSRDLSLWAMYMAGTRSKRLLLEGYDKLTPAQKELIDDAAEFFDGDTEKDRAWNALIYSEMLPFAPQTPTVTRRDLLKGIGAAVVATKAPVGKPSPFDDIAKKIILPRLRERISGRRGSKKAKYTGRIADPATWENPQRARYNWVKRLTDEGATEEEANAAIDRVIHQALDDQALADKIKEAAREQKAEETGVSEDQLDDKDAAIKRAKQAFGIMVAKGREHLWTPIQVNKMQKLGDHYPQFERVAKEYGEWKKKLLDFAEEAGVINSETRPMWEHADHIPFSRIVDDRLIGGLHNNIGIANQRSPIIRLEGGESNVGELVHNMLMNITNLMDVSMKNRAALRIVDAMRGTGFVSKNPLNITDDPIRGDEVIALLKANGMDPQHIPAEVLKGFQQHLAKPREGEGMLSVLRNGKKEYYYTTDHYLFRAMTALNLDALPNWVTPLRLGKRFVTGMITLAPGFMLISNPVRDTASAFVLSRDRVVPIISALEGFGKALLKSEEMRTMMSAGAAFENGYLNTHDPDATMRAIKRELRNKGFMKTVLDTPRKLGLAYKALGAATENMNRIAVYNAALAAGKTKEQAVFESKDLQDFSMGGDWGMIRFLMQTVAFWGARQVGLVRLGRGFVENPMGFAMKGSLLTMAGLSLWFAFRDDDRYKALEDWDKDTYFHWWIGDNHWRLPKPFEVGAIFNTVPERIMEHMYSEENDAGKLLMRRWGFMLAETFAFTPIPSLAQPMVEAYFNYDMFRGRSVTSVYEEQRLGPEQYRNYTSPTMRELAKLMPGWLQTDKDKIRSPLHLENFFLELTGTVGRYLLMASDELVRTQMNYPIKPTMRAGDRPVTSRVFRGDEPRRTRYEEEVYRVLRKVVQIQNSLRFLEKTNQEIRFEDLELEWEPYIRVADDLEDIREDVTDLNKDIWEIQLDRDMDPNDKRKALDEIQLEKNMLFEMGYSLRPGGKSNPIEDAAPVTTEQILDLIDNFGVDDVRAKKLEDTNPETFDLTTSIQNLNKRELESLSKQGTQ